MSTKFVFVLESFRIRNTRSADEDTDYVSVSLAVGATAPISVVRKLGDVDNGIYLVNAKIGPIDIASDDVAVFNYIITNSGHSNSAEVEQNLGNAGKALASQGAKAVVDAITAGTITLVGATVGTVVLPIIGTALGALAGQVVNLFVGVLFANCDGPVAVEQVPTTGTKLLESMSGNQPWRRMTVHPGTDSPSGCGSNSLYEVTWQILKAGVPLSGYVHLEDYGNRTFINELFAGTKGEEKRLEGFNLKIDPAIPGLNIEYFAHVQDIGDTPWTREGTYVGTTGQNRRLEGFAMRLTGANAGRYDIVYMAHLADAGDTSFYRNGAFCGTRGQNRAVEGIFVQILPK